MQRHIITVKSITYAIKGRDALRKQGYNAYTERKTNLKGNAGCGYVIVVKGNRDAVLQILSNSKINIIEINSIA